METRDEETYQKIIAYINKRFGVFIKYEGVIWYGQASFTVEMLADCSYETYTNHPEKGLEYIVDFTFDYLCT